MSYSFMRWPHFKIRALTFSYDDGDIADRRVIEQFNKYGMKGTFNLNSDTVGREHKVAKEELYTLYEKAGHEVATHGCFHYSFDEVPSSMIMDEILVDRKFYEGILKHPVTGHAYPNGSFSERAAEVLQECGISYARTIQSTGKFAIPSNWLQWHPTSFHKDKHLMEYIEEFLSINPVHYFHKRALLLYIWGHSYEFDRDDCWHILDQVGEKLGNREDIWYATNMEIYEYVNAYNSLVFAANGESVKNPNALDVYICYFGKNYVIPAGTTIKIEK